MQTAPSLMLQETEQSPSVVAKLLAAEVGTFAEIGRLFEKLPTMITTAARGSSDHAATFFKYLMEIATGIPVASIGPSVASVYGAKLKLGVVCISLCRNRVQARTLSRCRMQQSGVVQRQLPLLT